jgi:hypothetical protein
MGLLLAGAKSLVTPSFSWAHRALEKLVPDERGEERVWDFPV